MHTSARTRLDYKTFYNYMEFIGDSHEGRGVSENLTVNASRETLDEGGSDGGFAKHRKLNSTEKDQRVSQTT